MYWCLASVSCAYKAFKRKYKQVVGLMEEEGWIPCLDWIDDNTESVLEWKEPNSMGDESSIELSDNDASDAEGSGKSCALFPAYWF
jgi:hypothetical protein